MQCFVRMCTKCDYVQHVIDNHDIVPLQEHWLYDSQCHVFEDRFPEVSAYCVSGMNENCLGGGRGYGGCAILWKTSLSCTIEPINLDNKRICAVKITLHDISFMLCCVYMPCDTTYDQNNVDIYNAVFSNILNSNVCNDVATCARDINERDLNTALSRTQSAHTECLRNICEREYIKCVKLHDHCDINYTYESKSNDARSCIDHFIVSEGLFDYIEYCSVLHDGDNLSDHDVVSLHMAIMML